MSYQKKEGRIKEAGIYFFQWQIEKIVDLHLTYLGRSIKIKIFLLSLDPRAGQMKNFLGAKSHLKEGQP